MKKMVNYFHVNPKNGLCYCQIDPGNLEITDQRSYTFGLELRTQVEDYVWDIMGKLEIRGIYTGNLFINLPPLTDSSVGTIFRFDSSLQNQHDDFRSTILGTQDFSNDFTFGNMWTQPSIHVFIAIANLPIFMDKQLLVRFEVETYSYSELQLFLGGEYIDTYTVSGCRRNISILVDATDSYHLFLRPSRGGELLFRLVSVSWY